MVCGAAEEKAMDIDSEKLKKISRMYESGLSAEEISQKVGAGTTTIKRLLKLLGYPLPNEIR